MPGMSPPMNAREPGPSGAAFLRGIAITLLVVHAYLGIGTGVYEVSLRQFDARCGTATHREAGAAVVFALFWPAQLVARAVIIASRQPASDCKAY